MTTAQVLAPHPPKQTALRRLASDPRHLQIGILLSLLAYGRVALDFEVSLLGAILILSTTLATEALLASGRSFDPRSPLISGLSLCLLLRANDPVYLVLAAFVAIASKYWIRAGGKHVFNPTNLAIVVVVYTTDGAWVSPGQWGSEALAAAAVVCAGALVLRRAERGDVTLAFVVFWCALLFGRSAWLGEPMAIPLHALESGGLLLFAFFMLSDPRTTPDSRAGRVLFAALVAAVAGAIQFALYRPHGLFIALAACAPLVPLIDRFLPGLRFRWPGHREEKPMLHRKPSTAHALGRVLPIAGLPIVGLCLALVGLLPQGASAFCGFYVAKADTGLFNEASQVVLARHKDRTVITMASDYRGEPKEFAMVIPVPTFIEREQIHVAEPALVEHLDAYTAPRLVEYFDADPCRPPVLARMSRAARQSSMRMPAPFGGAKALGVTIEASYTVGEYDILILAAEQSDGLVTWLRQSGYRLPEGASEVVGSYLKQGMRFFVAKVNLGEREKLGLERLRPIQVAYESPKFMLPIRLGMLNAEGPQELFVYTLTRKGRVETTNYRTVKLPTGGTIPTYVKGEFGEFYRAMFEHQVEREEMRAVFLEYAWNMAWCDPCAADPLSDKELRELGVWWVDESAGPGPAPNAFVTRLHLRYDGEHFPQDLVFQETSDRGNFQGRYVLQHAFAGEMQCEAATRYREDLVERREQEIQTLAKLTGWDPVTIRQRTELADAEARGSDPQTVWWKRLWN
ncbi:MAG: DUF2330 domain-containing protein [Deltaproteobacteria bacterium]|nr:DUF2330 domain-containing protein [Deltaproteobacteria bacterium]MBW2420432.1 DUF2330 domain-containing protein [Deltaproteobacteria bacterium]